jgi:DNA end-binding protein Ku
LLNKKQKGLPITASKRPASGNVVDLMSALKASIAGGKRTPAAEKKAGKATRKAKAPAKRKAS